MKQVCPNLKESKMLLYAIKNSLIAVDTRTV